MAGAVRGPGQPVVLRPAATLVVRTHGVVDVAHRQADLRGLEHDLLAALDGVPDLALARRRLAVDPGARDVRAVAVHLAADVDQDHRALAHGLRLLGAVRIGAGFVQQHQPELVLAAEGRVRGGDQRGDVGAAHAGLDLPAHVPDRVNGDVVRRLHQRDLGRGLDRAAGVDERLAGDDLAVEARHPAHVVHDEEARAPLDRDRAARTAGAHRIRDQRERALVLVPGPHVGLDPQRLFDGGHLEERRDDDGLALRRDQRRGGALGAPPADPGEVFERGTRFDQHGGDLVALHQRLELRDARRMFRGRDGLRVRREGAEFAGRCLGSPRTGTGGQGRARGGHAKKVAPRDGRHRCLRRKRD